MNKKPKPQTQDVSNFKRTENHHHYPAVWHLIQLEKEKKTNGFPVFIF